MIEATVSVGGYGDDGGSFIKITRQADEPAEAVTLALIAAAEYVRSPKLDAVAEAAYRITREGS